MKTSTKLSKAVRIPASEVNNGHGTEPVQKSVELPMFKEKSIALHIRGISPLIVHRWSEKAMREMLDKQLGKATKGREKKDPLADFKSTLYPVEGTNTFGVPAPAFKSSAITAANDIQLKMTEMRRAFHVKSYTVPILAEPLTKPVTEWDITYKDELAPYHKLGISMRMDMVRLDNGSPDIRFRAQYPEWSCVLDVDYNEALLSVDQICALFRAAGYGCGICEMRPSAPKNKSGEFGRFTLE